MLAVKETGVTVVLSSHVVADLDLSGRFLSNRTGQDAYYSCLGSASGGDPGPCMERLGYRSAADLVQPGDRFWWFQAIDATLFTAAGVLCLVGALWWLRKRFRREIRVPAAV